MLHTSQHSLPTPQSLVVNSGYSVSLNNICALMLNGLPLPSSTGCISNNSSSADHCAGVWGGSGPECSWSSTDSRLQHRTSSSRGKRYCGCTAVHCTPCSTAHACCAVLHRNVTPVLLLHHRTPPPSPVTLSDSTILYTTHISTMRSLLSLY